jgi:hypothetical protein
VSSNCGGLCRFTMGRIQIATGEMLVLMGGYGVSHLSERLDTMLGMLGFE